MDQDTRHMEHGQTHGDRLKGWGNGSIGQGNLRDYVPRLKSHCTTLSAPPRLTHRDWGFLSVLLVTTP